MYSTFLGMQLNCIKKNTKVLNISFSDIFLSKMGVKVAEIKLIFVQLKAHLHSTELTKIKAFDFFFGWR